MRKQICHILLELKPDLNLDAAEPLVTSGALDSFDLVMLIIDLGEAFGVKFMPADLVPDNFDTVDGIVALVSAKQESSL